ncbi:hypothetical protein KIN20_015427 [Parelaphostrongylus tenuis]|uniref:Uncharacterized protein n=1 Tax=Parelaphostrongylus tenuis TaxID=148309 RepID=A0AAD5N0A9_PARTN|nr:hypothetical protein KIN20_015427 [Parelaphostrongylus tenuis]
MGLMQNIEGSRQEVKQWPTDSTGAHSNTGAQAQETSLKTASSSSSARQCKFVLHDVTIVLGEQYATSLGTICSIKQCTVLAELMRRFYESVSWSKIHRFHLLHSNADSNRVFKIDLDASEQMVLWDPGSD